MKRLVVVMSGIAILSFVAAYADCCGSANASAKASCPVGQLAQAAPAAEAPAAAPAPAREQTTCPVMEGQPINKNLYADYNGKRVYFCCRSCQAAFKKDPAKYVQKLEAAGVKLDDTPKAP